MYGAEPPLERSSFTADFDSARVLVIALQGKVERYPDRLVVIVEHATFPPMAGDGTLRAALAEHGPPVWAFSAMSAALGGEWVDHGGGVPWTPMRFVIPVRDSTGEAQRDLAFVFDSGVGERGGIQRRVVMADVRRAPPDDR